MGKWASAAVAVSVLFAGTMITSAASAANNPPPAGQVIFSLDGQPLPHQYTNYSVSFVATDTTTNLAFAFREDPAYFSLDNVTLTTAGGANLVTNGDFEQGPVGSQTPNGWSYLNLYNASAAGIVRSGCGTGGSNCYYDGAVGSYDTITQQIATVIGSQYNLSFDLTDNSGQTLGSSVESGAQAGINLVVYAGSLPTASAVPEPASWAMMVGGFGIIGGALRRKKIAVGFA